MPSHLSQAKQTVLGILALFFIFSLLRPALVKAQTAGPIGHWAFDEGSGTTASDSSGNNLNGTISGATWTTGKIGSGALNFNGTNSYVNVASPALLTNVNTFTWSAWLNPGASQTHSVNPIIEKGSGSNTLKSFYITDTGSVVAEIKTASGYASSASITGVATAGAWSQWTITYNDTGDRMLHIYKNGVEVSYSSQVPATTALADDTGYNMYFGATPDTAYYVFNGSIDDVQIFNRVLSSAEIQTLASGGSLGGSSTDTTAPTTPTGLSATAVSSSQINLSWTASIDNVGVAGYNIYRNGVLLTTTTGTTYSNTALSASTLYSYTVSAYDAAGNTSTQSAVVSATTQSATPPPTCTSFTYSAWNACQVNGTQTRTVTSSSPAGCTGGTPVLTQSCTYTAPPPSTSTAGPVILYTDIITGPNTGGENNDGAYLTIFGKGFGATQGSSQVTINNVPVAVYKQWYDNKITIQPGPSVTSGAIRVIVGGVSSNSNQTFTVVPGRIFFVALNGNDSTGVIGDITHPFRTIQTVLNRSDFAPGDQVVVRGGNWSDVYPLYGSFFSIAYIQGTAAAPIVVMGYPTETVNLVYNGTQTRGIHSWATTGHFVIANFHMDQGGKGLAIGITPGATDVRIVNNEVKNGYEDSGGAGYIDGSGTNFKILGNSVHDNGGSKLYHAMYFDARANPSGNVEIAYNTIYNETGGRGIQIYGDTGTLINNISIHNNIIHDIHLDGILLGSYSGTGDQVYDNIVYNTANAAFQGPSTDAGSGGSCLRFNSSTLTATVYNNTFYNCAMDNGVYSTGIENQALGSVTFANNIVDTSGGLGYFDNTSSTGGITATNNLWYGSGATPSWSASSVNADPSFVNAAGANFHLNSTSPAIDKGSSLASSVVTSDIEGTPRPQGSAYDIGAYEYASGSTTTSPPPSTPAPTVSLSASPTSVT
ncbi:MAG: LamG-like jellyroll fold domain-containing protein, partial [Thermomicrobiales bacterium]